MGVLKDFFRKHYPKKPKARVGDRVLIIERDGRYYDEEVYEVAGQSVLTHRTTTRTPMYRLAPDPIRQRCWIVDKRTHE